MREKEIINQEGEKIGSLILNEKIWKTPFKIWNISLVNKHFLSNKRQGTKKTKKKSEVSGGGRKPWKQKGTGRARQGSIRSPQFRGGGVVFGPSGEEKYSFKVNKKEKKKVFYSILAKKMQENEIFIIDKIDIERKTKKAEKILDSVLKKEKAKSLIVLSKDERKEKNIFNSFRNLPYVKITDSYNINFLEIFLSTYLIFTYNSFIELEGKKTRDR